MHNPVHELTLSLAFFLGALHALEPGHGKTTMLVYLSGERRSFWHPLVMGLSSAIAHSISLIAIAMAVHFTQHLVSHDHHHENETVTGALQWISSLLVLFVGMWMLLAAWRSKPIQCNCKKHRHEGCGNKSPSPKSSFSMSALLGIAFGLLPCPSALAAYFTSMSTGSPVTAYTVIGLFAAGIACSLTCFGILIQYFGSNLIREESKIKKLPWPYIRAYIVLGVGIFYAVRLWITV